ncbi:uncharacterized protein LOC142558310 [Dermacentor variabilis]|uniref:uncharacterized protein LOC142558310 n=1 Tax=Dermacentor variabilis TaxID=34621 RepID=UPI003F5AF58C
MSKISKELSIAFDDLKNEIKNDLKLFRESFERDIRSELREIKASLSSSDEKFNEMTVDLKKVLDENKRLRVENESLKQQCNLLNVQLNKAEVRITECEQYSRNRNLEIKGIPMNRAENLLELIGKIGDKIGEPILPTDVELCHRVSVPGGSMNMNAIVQFARRQKRDAVLEKARKKRITCKDLGFTVSTPIYINEHLCPERKRLLGQTISKKRDVNWKFVWVRGGQIFARKDEKSRLLKVISSADLVKMI